MHRIVSFIYLISFSCDSSGKKKVEMNFMKFNLANAIYGLLIILCYASCANTKKVAYFNNISDTTLQALNIDLEPVIQKGDVLSISVSSITPEAAIVFNTPNTPSVTSTSATSYGSLAQASGYLVDQDGYIQFPMLGNIKVAGIAKKVLKDQITLALKERKLLFDPIVSIRYLNFHVTVLGEVGRPGMVMVPGEQVTILEALGLAGDLTIYGQRNNVLLLRNENGKRTVHRLNLTSPSVLSSPYYYLKTNDVIYVEPDSNKVASVSQSRQLWPTVISALSFLAIITDLIISN